MKLLVVIAFILAWTACNSGTEEKSDEVDAQDGFGSNGATDTSLWVGIFARWKFQQGIVYTGNYDTVTNIFRICRQNTFYSVPRNAVTIIPADDCDEIKSRVTMVLMRKDTIRAMEFADWLDLEADFPAMKVYDGGKEKTIYLGNKDVLRIKQFKHDSPNEYKEAFEKGDSKNRQ